VHLLSITDPRAACRLLAGVKSAKTDAADKIDLAALVARGAAYQVRGDHGKTIAAYLLEASNGALWITAATGRASVCLVRVIDAAASSQARACGLSSLAFRTERRGLVRKAERIGYRVTRQDGKEYFMRKTITC